MMPDRFERLDTLAAPNNYTVPSTKQDIDYILYFRQVCKRYNINFTVADPDERDFVIRMADKGFYSKRA